MSEVLRKAERTVQEAVESAEIEVEVYEESDGFINSKNKFDLLVAKQREVSSRKWIPSNLVASEWDKREKEFASFLEVKRKEFLDYVDDIQAKAKELNQVQALVVLENIKVKHRQVYGGEGK